MVQLGARQEPQSLVTLRKVVDLQAVVGQWRQAGQRIAVVPTMGALHEGHLALVRRARADCDRVVATLFVNPAQFDRKEDLADYPRDESADAALFAAEGVDLLYAPAVEDVYPPGFATKVTVPTLTNCLCGLHRPGHMEGVATVVAKLFVRVQADFAYFGEKDYQQLLVVSHMARDLDLPVRVIGVPTVREADGLALSSRNVLLSEDERRRAPTIYRVLDDIARSLKGGAEAAPLIERGRAALTAAGFTAIDYLDLRDAETLQLLSRAEGRARLFAAAWMGDTRLIDNLPVG